MEEKKQNRKTAYGLISQHRAELMGVAILLAVFNHCTIDIYWKPLAFLKDTQFCSDMFVFLSGIGIWQSLKKHTAAEYLRNRITRILPPWWIYLAVYAVLGYFQMGIRYTLPAFIGFASFTGYWINLPFQGNWYGYAIMLFYLLAPLVYALLKESAQPRRTAALLFAVALTVPLAFLGQRAMIAAVRLPIFLLGMYFSAFMEEKPVTAGLKTGCSLSVLLGLGILTVIWLRIPGDSYDRAIWWYPNLLVTPGLCLGLAWLFEETAKLQRPVLRMLKTLGSAAFEILLSADYIMLWTYDRADRGWISAAIVLVSVLVGLVFHAFVERTRKFFGRSR